METDPSHTPRVPLHIRMVVLLFFVGTTIWLCTSLWTGFQLLLYSEQVSGEVLARSSSKYPTYQVEVRTPDAQFYTAWISSFLSTYKLGQVVELQWVPYQASTIQFPGYLIRVFITFFVYCLCVYTWWMQLMAIICNRYSESLPDSTKKLFR